MTDVGNWWETGTLGASAPTESLAGQVEHGQVWHNDAECQANRVARSKLRDATHQHIVDERRISALVEELKSEARRRGELEAENAKLRSWRNGLADECGRLRDENTQLLAENARLRRGKPR